MSARTAPKAGVQGPYPRGRGLGRIPSNPMDQVSFVDLIEGLTMAAYFLAGFLFARMIIRLLQSRA